MLALSHLKRGEKLQAEQACQKAEAVRAAGTKMDPFSTRALAALLAEIQEALSKP